jgi:hypothetical protein
MRIGIAAASILALAAVASADTITVPGDQPTIQAGVTAAATGDTVSVAKGVYFENVVVATPGIRIVGKGAVLDGNLLGVDGDCLTVNADGLVVQGILFRNGNDQIVLNANGLQVSKCTFQDAGSSSIAGTGNDVSVTGSRFTGTAGAALDVVGDRLAVSKCQVLRLGAAGIVVTGADARVESCTFVGIDDNQAVDITGDGALVSRNKASLVDQECFLVNGNNAIVEGNKGDRSDGRLVVVNGIGAVVQRNSAAYCQGGVNVNGDTAQILSNRFSNIGSSDAIAVNGDDFTVTGNAVTTTWDDGDGISANSATVAGGGLVEGNRVSDIAGYGFNLDTIFNATVRTNSATRCGQDNRGGFNVTGDGNTLQLLSAVDVEGPGILVDGNGNTVTSCVVKKALTDGFHVANGGSNNTFDRCSASACGGEGFDNGAVNTAVTNSDFLKNRIDVANDVLGGATIPGGLGSVNFKTGGAATQPEVD